MNLDERISRFLFEHVRKKHWSREMAIFCASFLIWLMAGFAIGMFFPLVHKMIPMIFLPWGISILFSQWIRRPRPFYAEHYKPLIELAISTPSFPSQHATIAFSLVAIFLNDPFIWPFLLMAAILVGVGRLAVGVHYLSDVVVGAMMGFGVAYAVKLAAQLFAVVS